MVELSSKQELLDDLTSYFDYDHRDWVEFLIDDCRDFVASLHSFRLQHLYGNREQFARYIDTLQKEYLAMLEDEALSLQAETTVQALFLLSCVEFASASRERMIIKEMIED